MTRFLCLCACVCVCTCACVRANMYVEEKGRKGRIGVYERKRMKREGFLFNVSKSYIAVCLKD